jgi:hypothetical protein
VRAEFGAGLRAAAGGPPGDRAGAQAGAHLPGSPNSALGCTDDERWEI